MLATARIASAQPQVPSDSSAVIVPSAKYGAGGLHRFLLGGARRHFWTTPIRLPVVDLARFGGGLRATERGGSAQTRSLRFTAGDGRAYTFRSLDKDPTQRWPELLRKTPARWLAEDQISAILPAGALLVGSLEQSAGLPRTGRVLVILPDDERLGEWRSEFRGNAGFLETRLRGTPEDLREFPGASEVVTTEHLFEKLHESSANFVDQRRFLAARLFDLIVGDWDRHADQWSWLRYDEGQVHRWAPIPRDRDWALSRLDGVAYSLLRLYAPNWQAFGSSYGSIYGLTLQAEPLDRRLLTGLDRPVWDSIVRALQGRLDAAAIQRALRQLPAEFNREAVNELAAELTRRRETLPEAAARFYRQLSRTVEVRGSDLSENVVVERTDDGSLSLRLGPAGQPPTFARRFERAETGEVRIFLFGGADTVRARGPVDGIKVRVIPGGGGDVLADSTGKAGVRVYDNSEDFQSRSLAEPKRVRHAFTSPVEENSPYVIYRDWGHLYAFSPWFEVQPEVGALLGGGPILYRFAFRRVPYQSRIALRAAYATGASGLNVDLHSDFRFENPTRRVLFDAAALDVDLVRYFGLGNETQRIIPSSIYNVRQRLYLVEPTLQFGLARGTTLGLTALMRYSTTELDPTKLLGTDRPYGSGGFSEAGLGASLGYDSRDHAKYPTSGVMIRATGRLYPKLLDVESTFGSLGFDASTYLTARIPTRPTLALRVGGMRVFGTYPFFEAASIGGRSSVRGLSNHRFIGDKAAYGSAELRLAFGRFVFIAPGEWGVYGLFDEGRVYLEGENSDTWHSAKGGGLWFAFLDRRSTMTITYADAKEGGRLYIQAGFHY